METGTDISVEDFLAEDRPHHLSAWLHMGGVGKPAGVIGEAGAVEEGTAQPDEDDGQMAEVGGEDPPRYLLKVARVSVEVVSVGVKVPNPGGGFGTFRESSVEVSGLTEQLEGCWIVNLLDLAFASLPRSGGLMVIESFLEGRVSRWWATPPKGRSQSGPRTRIPRNQHSGVSTARGRNPLSALKLGPQRGDRWRKHRGGEGVKGP